MDYVFVDHPAFHAYARETAWGPGAPAAQPLRILYHAMAHPAPWIACSLSMVTRLCALRGSWRFAQFRSPTPTPPCLPADEIYGGSRQDIQFRCALLTKAALEAPWVVPCGGATYGQSGTRHAWD